MALWVLLVSSVTRADCPSAEIVVAQLEQLDLDSTHRGRVLELAPPWSLYRDAAAATGKVATERRGELGQAVAIYELPLEALWMAVNDEDHYAAGDYLPVEHSEVIGGTPRGESRVLFQYFRRSGVGRWWVDRVAMNRELFESSSGRLWELEWWDLMQEYGPQGPPAPHTNLDLVPIEGSTGAWLMISLSDRCTLVEYVTVSNPGGWLSIANWFGAKRVMRENLEGLRRLAVEHIPQPHPQARFVRPDGTLIDPPERPSTEEENR